MSEEEGHNSPRIEEKEQENEQQEKEQRKKEKRQKREYKQKKLALKETEAKIQALEDLVQETSIISYNPECIRKKSNWSKTADEFKFDNEDYAPDFMKSVLEHYSPKLHALLDKIRELDAKDKKTHGKLYKHFIFSDLKFGNYGAKMLASAMISAGYHLGYTAEPKEPHRRSAKKRGGASGTRKRYNTIQLHSDQVLKQTPDKNFYMLSSVGVYDQNITVKMKKEMLRRFNERPENAHGDLIRFIILDSGFKEGIDLFDVKYVHIFEPPTYLADQKQVIGRSTRTCGQKGIEFHPTFGWPLHVFIYDLSIPESIQNSLLGSKTAMELYLKSMNLDLRLLNFTHDLEQTTIAGSVDYDLNKNVHSFSIPSSVSGGAGQPDPVNLADILRGIVSDTGPRRPTHAEMRAHIQKYYSEFAWDVVKMENLCEDKGRGGSGQILTYTPTQDFIRHYFHPMNPIKGMLLFLSVGTGKTCSAIAAATSNFEKNGYTILWVTRTTLKNDIWKNMFDQVCNESIRNQIEYQDLEIPKEQSKRMRLLSPAWKIRPMSYKQFSNLILKQNAMYESLVKINGTDDPLRKTLLIIDEAHKLYGGDDLSSIEKPDMGALQRALQHSYQFSGQDSARLLLMTATPITKDPMELIKLVNLCKPATEQMPAEFADFSAQYLDERGDFTADGRAQYLDDIAGYVSYLNREKDARQFAQPQIETIQVPIIKNAKDVEKFDKRIMREILDAGAGDVAHQLAAESKKLKGELGQANKAKFEFLKDEICGDLTGKPKTQCVKVVNKNVTQLVKEVKGYVKDIKEKVKELRTAMKSQKKLKTGTIKEIIANIKTYSDDYETYKTTQLYELKSKCAKRIRNMGEIDANIRNHPAIKQYDKEIARYNTQIADMETELKQLVENYKGRMRQLRGVLKTDLSPVERNVVNMVIREERAEYGRVRRQTKRQNKYVERDLRKNIKDIEKQRSKRKREVVKKIRKTIKDERKQVKVARHEVAKLRKTARIKSKGIKHEVLKDLVSKYQSKIMEELVDVSEAEMEKEREKEQMKQEKERMKLENARRKAAEKEHNKMEKLLEREHARETKKRMQEEKKAAREQEKLAKKAARKTKKKSGV